MTVVQHISYYFIHEMIMLIALYLTNTVNSVSWIFIILKQHHAGRDHSPFWYNILTPSQTGFVLHVVCLVDREKNPAE